MPRPEPVSSRASAAPVSADTESSLRFSVVNLVLLGAGLAAIVAGFALLGGHSTVLAPLLLVLGFAVLVPLGIIR
jgi:fatty acid desaturase